MKDLNFTDIYVVENRKKPFYKTCTLTSMDVADNKTIDLLGSFAKICQLLLRAANNRTRERNYFRLYSQLLEKEISDEEFEREISDNDNNYVLANNFDADSDDVALARILSPYLMDVKDMDDLADIFSFSYTSVNKCIEISNE